jgi:hypothetical protein
MRFSGRVMVGEKLLPLSSTPLDNTTRTAGLPGLWREALDGVA